MTPIPELTLPPGFRFMYAHEADCMTPGDPIVLLTPAGLEHATVRGFTEDKMRVVLRSAAILSLDLDDPDFWPDGVSRDRKPPTDGEAVAIVRIEDEDETGLDIALKASIKFDRRLTEVEKELAALRHVVALRLGITEAA